jgi:multidrug resistance efflux pump
MPPAEDWSAPKRPKLRTDLSIVRTASGNATLFEVRAPESLSACTLYDIELGVANLMDGSRDLPTIVDAGRKGGVPMNVEQLEKFIRQLTAFHLVENAAPLPPAKPVSTPGPVRRSAPPNEGGPTTQPFSREAIGAAAWSAPQRPKLRLDLEVQKITKGAQIIFEVRDPKVGSVCTLYDVELAVAQLMDGKRDLDTIVKAGRSVGLPMDLVQLQKFIRQLAAYRFIENAAPLPPLFAPQVSVPTTQTVAGRATAPERPAVESAPPKPLDNRALLLDVPAAPPVEDHVEERRPAPALSTGEMLAAPQPLPAKDLAEVTASDSAPAPRRGIVRPRSMSASAPLSLPSRWPPFLVEHPWRAGIGAFGGFALIVILVAIRVPATVTRPCATAAADPQPVRVEVDGKVASVAVGSGQLVAAGDVLARLDDAAAKDALNRANADAARAQQQADAAHSRPSAKELSRAKKLISTRQRELTAAKRKTTQLIAKAKKHRAQLKQVEAAKRVEQARQAALDRATSAFRTMQAGASPEASAAAEQGLQSALAAKTAAQKQYDALVIRSPAHGIVATPNPEQKVGASVKAGDVLFEIGSPEAVAIAIKVSRSNEDLAVIGAPIAFRYNGAAGAAFEGKVTQAKPTPDKRSLDVSMQLDSRNGLLKPDMRGQVTISGVKRSLLVSALKAIGL